MVEDVDGVAGAGVGDADESERCHGSVLDGQRGLTDLLSTTDMLHAQSALHHMEYSTLKIRGQMCIGE